ncbi:MAG TPA: diguanylate cyclase [Desulfuromonadales bacterium]|nr:diguanylate cyclase [Desulfuromonadales bacterium]
MRHFSITGKVVFGYLVITFCSLLAVGYALHSLHEHNQRTEQLVGVQFRAFNLLRDIRQNLLAQENLEQQIMILQDPQLLSLFERRNAELERILTDTAEIRLPEHFTNLPLRVVEYTAQAELIARAYADQEWEQAAALAQSSAAPLRTQLLEYLADLRAEHQTFLDQALSQITRQSGKAYQWALTISLSGILLAAPVVLMVVVSLHRSIRTLQAATREIASGRYEGRIEIDSRDEFGQLALDFSSMARKLAELEQLHLDANPLTRLPGNLAIDRELEQRISSGQPFAHLYIDLDNFKAYSDHYGYKAGSDAINRVGGMLRDVVAEHGCADDLVGHIGGDDYVVLSAPDCAEELAGAIVSGFEKLVPELYEAADLEKGFVTATDRYGIKRSFPLLTISIAVTLSENLEKPTLLTVSRNCATMKEHLKKLKGSNYLIDRRKQML